MIFKDRVEKIPEDNFFLFRSCIASNQYPGIQTSTKYVLDELKVKYFESDDQTCCAGCALFSMICNLNEGILVSARNLTIAEDKNVDTLVMCNGCYSMLNETKNSIERLNLNDNINSVLKEVGREYQGITNIHHTAEVLYKKRGEIREKIKRNLSGVKIAVMYGCHYLKTFHESAIDDAEMPRFLEELIEITGAEPVDYPEKMLCCGAGIGLRFVKRDITLSIAKRKLKTIKKSNADAIVTICPYCLLNLDRSQQELNVVREVFDIPVLYISQLLALGMGMDTKKIGCQAHLTNVDNLLKMVR